MSNSVKERLQNRHSYDETDRTPDNIDISRVDIFMYIVAILGHFVDIGVDINIAVQYYLLQHLVEFGWTLVFILLPAFVNTAVSVRMYVQDKSQLESLSDQVTRIKWLRIFILILQMAPIMRLCDALIYALKSRKAGLNKDPVSQRKYYALMLKEDADAALLRIFECFLEAAPQHLLQAAILYRTDSRFTLHQSLSILSSIIGMGWCLAAYQRALRFAQEDKLNMDWRGSLLQTLWHFCVTLSRIAALSAIAYLYPHWTIVACSAHILIMTTWVQLYDRPPFCAPNRLAEAAFSLALGAVYLFTYILPVEGKTRYRYAVYYTISFIENITCCALWYVYCSPANIYFIPVLTLSIVPFVLGMVFMFVYYAFLHPKVRKGVRDFEISFKVDGDVEMSNNCNYEMKE